MAFLETVDEILMSPTEHGEKTKRAGIGVYLYYDDYTITASKNREFGR